MKTFQKGKQKIHGRALGWVLAMIMVAGSIISPQAFKKAEAAETTITSMSYYSSADGPVISKTGVEKESYGFVMPKFNGGNATWKDVSSDLTVNVKENGKWVNIDEEDNFTYNKNWGHWSDSGFYGYWFTVTETTYIQLVSKANKVTLDYTLKFTKIPKTKITSMKATQGPELTVDATGSTGFTYPTFNGDSSIPYEAVANDLKVYVKTVGSSEWTDIDNNAASGWIYDSNFGQFTDGGGGYWFKTDESINVKLESKSTKASLIYTLTYKKPVRKSYKISAYDTTSVKADAKGSVGIALPKIDGSAATKSELDNFVYEIKRNGKWVDLTNFSSSGFRYAGNGYSQTSDADQWGYWVDHIFGLWFCPVQKDMDLRIGYPLDGKKGGEIGGNYVNYSFTGNPSAPRPDVSDLDEIKINTTKDTELNGWNMVWNDEFNGSKLNNKIWNYNTGYYINDDPGTWGWGNNELEYYTDSEKNVFVKDGNLNITAYKEPKSFPQDPSRVATYSSGKITTKDKFTFKYGRIDFRAKLPTGNGMWPALWMLPNDSTYGAWAASGEIDVMEARGRLPGATSGTIHFGGEWPANKYIGGDYAFPEGKTFKDYHVYSLVWEENNIKWYVDGKCFYKVTSDQWFSTGASDDDNAPFDQEFYIIMNLAVGGLFDGSRAPEEGDIPANMQVDYVRVYKPTKSDASETKPETVPVTGMTLDQKEVTLTAVGETTSLTKTITPGNASNMNVTWESSNPEVATVSAGQVTAVGNGITTIKAITKDGGFSSTCKVTVKVEKAVEPATGYEAHGMKVTGDKAVFYVNGATFADLHYIKNKEVQQNVAMTSDGKRNYTYTVSNLKAGDKIEYFFTYNPGEGALDTKTYTYTHK